MKVIVAHIKVRQWLSSTKTHFWRKTALASIIYSFILASFMICINFAKFCNLE